MVVLIKLYIQEGFRVAEVHFCDGNERVLGGLVLVYSIEF